MSKRQGKSKERDKAVDLIESIPPNNTDAERFILCAVLDPLYAESAPETLDTVAGIVKADDFYSDANRRIFQALLAMRDAGEPIEAISLHNHLEKTSELEAVGGTAYIAEIVTNTALPTHSAHYARIVSDKAKLRRTKSLAASLFQECLSPDADPSRVRQYLDRAKDELDGRESSGMVNSRQWVLDGLFAMDAETEPAISTGFPALDEKLSSGFRRKNQIVIGARPRVGKTTTAGNLIRNICFGQKIPTAFFSLEMSRDEILKRMLADIADVYHGKIVQPKRLCKHDREQIVDVTNDLGECPFFIDDRCGTTLSEMLSKIRLCVRKNGVQIVFIDQASLINAELPSPTASKRDEITAVSIALKRIARELDIVVVLLCQLNRAGAQGANGTRIDERKIRLFRPSLEHLKESGSLEENADVVLLIHRAEVLIPDEDVERLGLGGKAEWIVAKNRHGKEGVVPMRFEGGFLRFTEDGGHEEETLIDVPPVEHKNYQPQFGAFDGRSAAAGEDEGYINGFE